MGTPWNWNTEAWDEYVPGKNDFSTKITEEALKGNTGAAAALEVLRNNYIGSDAYTGSKKQTNIFTESAGSGAAAASSVADKAAEKVEKVIKTATVKEEPEEKETKVIYSTFDPSGYPTITPEIASDTGGKILGYGIIAVIALVILDKIFG